MGKNYPNILGLLVIVAAISTASIGTLAFFNASKTISTNKFSAGTLDLDVTANDNINQPISIDNVGSAGQISGSRIWTVHNTGSLPGRLVFNLKNITNLENGCNEPEKIAEPNCEADNVGELGKAIKITALVNGQSVATTTLEDNHDFVYDNPKILEPGEEVQLEVEWAENDTGYGNEVQSDTVNFDMVFRLEQQQ